MSKPYVISSLVRRLKQIAVPSWHANVECATAALDQTGLAMILHVVSTEPGGSVLESIGNSSVYPVPLALTLPDEFAVTPSEGTSRLCSTDTTSAQAQRLACSLRKN